jgi:hypothetical protein
MADGLLSAGVGYPKLLLLLRYLAFTHSMLKAQPEARAAQQVPADAEMEELVSQLLCGERDPPPLPPEGDAFALQARPTAEPC